MCNIDIINYPLIKRKKVKRKQKNKKKLKFREMEKTTKKNQIYIINVLFDFCSEVQMFLICFDTTYV